MASDHADQYISIDETIDIKVEAVRAHKSQMKDWDPQEMIRQWGQETAQGKEMQYAQILPGYYLTG